jgi:hypothetical protein
VKNYLRRETVEPPRWLGTLLSADWKRALMTGLLVIWLMPGDIIVMLTVATNLEHNDVGLVAVLSFIVSTVLVAALPPAALPAVPQMRAVAHAEGARLDEHA